MDKPKEVWVITSLDIGIILVQFNNLPTLSIYDSIEN